jgi:hypothetical protein
LEIELIGEIGAMVERVWAAMAARPPLLAPAIVVCSHVR